MQKGTAEHAEITVFLHTHVSKKIRRSKLAFQSTVETLTFGFSSAMVTLLALLYTATQRTRVRARTRARLDYYNRTCAATRPCASTSTSVEWTPSSHEVESAVWARAGESQCALKRQADARARARRCFPFCFQVLRSGYLIKYPLSPC